jgi:ribosomal protein S27AE
LRGIFHVCPRRHSTYARGKLKERLFAAGIKQRECEMCGQSEIWNDHRMSLVLDHINGVSNDHRLENLRIVCADCAATLETHCGRNLPRERTCPRCGTTFVPRHIRHRYCSMSCVGASNGDRLRGVPQPDQRKVERPSHEKLVEDLRSTSFLAVGRKYGVSDNAVRKWLRWYEQAAEAGQEEAA